MPVTGVSLDEAKAYCSWAGGRLPTAAEWQYAAQGGDPSRLYPWGNEYGADGVYHPKPNKGKTSPPPEPSEKYAAMAASPFGLIDLVGNVWQYTADEFQDEHTRFVLLKGGSSYQINHVSARGCHRRAQAAGGAWAQWRLHRARPCRLCSHASERLSRAHTPSRGAPGSAGRAIPAGAAPTRCPRARACPPIP